MACVQGLLHQHIGSGAVQASVCLALASMCSSEARNATAAGQLALLADLQRPLREAHAPAVEAACLALCSMCRHPRSNNTVVAGWHGLLADLQGALAVHRSSADTVQAICQALQVLCSGSAESRVQAARHGLPADIQAAAEQHGGAHGGVDHWAQQALAAMSSTSQPVLRKCRGWWLDDVAA